MKFYFRRGKSISDEVRRIASEQLQLSIEDLTERKPDLHTAIHEFRKRCKRLRALLRIVRPNFSKHYAPTNRLLRDLARDLSYVRDAQALVEALDRLEMAIEQTGAFPLIRAVLLERKEAAAGGEEALHRKLDTMVPVLQRVMKSTKRWRIEGSGFQCVAGGLARTYRRGRRARKRCQSQPSTYNFHEWRKRVKYHWHHTILLHKACPELLNPHHLLAEELGDLLGHEHDYAVLTERLRAIRHGEDHFRDELANLLKQVERQQVEIRHNALALGGYLQAESSAALTKRWKTYFKIWKSR